LVSCLKQIGYFLILAFLLTLALTGSHVRAASEEFISYPAVNPVKIDGKFTAASEWNDTAQVPLSYGTQGVVGYFASKYDSQFIYFVWDFVADNKVFHGNSTIVYPDQVCLWFDISNDRTDRPGENDYNVCVMNTGSGSTGVQVYLSRGTGSDWSSWSETTEFSSRSLLTASPNSDKPHLVYEFRMPVTFANIKSHMRDYGVGFATEVWDGNTRVNAYLPSNISYDSPRTWATLTFSSIAIPEFFSQPVLVSSLILLLAVVAIYKHRDT